MIADFFESPNLFVVGDEKQAIYRFQGASVSNFLNFQKIWPSMKIISLSDNYRSHQSILDASFKMIEGNYEEVGDQSLYENLHVRLLSKNQKESKPIDIVTAENTDAEEKYIAENVAEILKGDPAATIAVIVRRNREVEKLLALFEEHHIEAKAERGADIFQHPVGILFFAFLEFLNDPSHIECLAKTIAGGMWNLSLEKQIEFIKEIRRGEIKNLEENIEKEIPDLAKIKEELIKGSPISFLIIAADLSGFTDLVKTDPISTEMWKGILKLAESITLQNEIESPSILIERLLEYKATAEHKTIKIVAGNARAQVTIMTAHSSKGLEFDYVFIPKALEEIWIGRKRGNFFVLPQEKSDGDAHN